MEFNIKLQELRRQKGLTQEELAGMLFVSRTAVSKWESGRGYPSIESMRVISRFFGVTVDELLSGDELLTIAEADTRQRDEKTCDVVFGLLDIVCILLFFLPFFGERTADSVMHTPLVMLGGVSPYILVFYYAFTAFTCISGILLLALQGCAGVLWCKIKCKLSLALSIFGTLLFIVSMQPYVAAMLFAFLVIKASVLIKRK